uniref:Vav 3 guanine nucleotide exchange factor b n=1 Tax=Eptatretus burgeri TaxID=7764 RepID=A0A8C4NGW7_EPTBU
MEPEVWRQCSEWLITCRVLPANHRVTFPESQVFELAQVLRDGVLLCQLLNNLQPGTLDLKQINQRPQMSQFLCLKNIRTFLNTCTTSFELQRGDLFDPFDLFEMRDFQKVISALSKLSHSEPVCSHGIRGFPNEDYTIGEDEGIYDSLEELADQYELDEEDDIYSMPADDCDEIYEDVMRKTIGKPKPTLGHMKQEDKRSCCLNELIETEQRYVETLESIDTCFLRPMRRHLSSKEVQSIFSNIEDLLQLHLNFFNEIGFSVRQNGHNLHQVFLNFKQRFVLYGPYCSQLETAQHCVEEICSHKDELKIKLEECAQRANGGKFMLRDLLVVPMQRVLKYHLLLKELLSHTSSPTDKEHLRTALDAMKDVAQHINEVKHDMDTMKTVWQFQSSIENLEQPLIGYGRPKKDGEVKVTSVTEKRTKQDRYIFLFDCAVVICKRRGELFDFRELLDLKEYKVTDDPTPNRENRKWSYGFFLAHLQGQNGFQFFCKTEELKRIWMEQFEMARSNIKPEKWNAQHHEFLMNTFKESTSCQACHMLLRGTFYQGYICKRCHVGGHKECLGSMEACAKPRQPGATQMTASKDYLGSPLPPPCYSPLITFEKDDIIELIQGDANSLWWEGRNMTTQRTGWFPCSCVEPYIVKKPSKKPITSYGGYPWFTDTMDRETAGSVLSERPHGTYLVRERTKEQKDYAISIKYKDHVKHIKIVCNDGKYHITENKRFKSMVQLVEYYQVHSLKEGFSSLDTNLKYAYKEIPSTTVPSRHPRTAVEAVPIGVAIARYDFVARDRREISFSEGDVIKIFMRTNDGMWKGECNGKMGYFPTSYVEEEMC